MQNRYTPSTLVVVNMFRISTKGDYGLLLLSALAEKTQGNDKFVPLKEIAEAKHLSLSYISQIIIPLKKSGLLISKEGLRGGYRLSKSPSEITLLEILETIEGPISPVRCFCGGKIKTKCGSEQYCNIKAMWGAARLALRKFLRGKTLADI